MVYIQSLTNFMIFLFYILSFNRKFWYHFHDKTLLRPCLLTKFGQLGFQWSWGWLRSYKIWPWPCCTYWVSKVGLFRFYDAFSFPLFVFSFLLVSITLILSCFEFSSEDRF